MQEIIQPLKKKVSKPYKTYQVVIPVLIGLFVIGWLFLSEFNIDDFNKFNFTYVSVFFILLAISLMLLRDFGIMWRFRMLTNNELSWKQTFHINTLHEFTSAVTPAAVGGSSLIMVFLIKEGISAGRSTTIMFINLFLDELYFIVVCPIIFLFIPINKLFNSSSVIVSTFGIVFFTLYAVRLVWITILFIGTFKRPHWIKHLLLTIFKLPFLNRWYDKIDVITNNMVETSHEIADQPFGFWAKAFGITIIAWSARFLVVNAVFMAFNPGSFNHLVVFARQLILWVYMIISPTPGGSGVTEYAFKEYYKDVFSTTSAIIFVTLVWRIISYYLYLLLGFLIIPKWISKSFSKNNTD